MLSSFSITRFHPSSLIGRSVAKRMMLRSVILTIMALAFFIQGAGQANGVSEIEAYVEKNLAASVAPGISYAVVDGGEVSVRAFGITRAGSDDPVTIDTPFPVGSVTKSFTALAIMQLAEARQLGLDDHISKHLTYFANGPASEVTIRQLLNHTSGYSTIQGNSLRANAVSPDFDRSIYMRHIASIKPANQPGSVWEYSNTNYQILGAVIEEVSGQDYAGYIASQIFAPLGMKHSSAKGGTLPLGFATGHRPWFGGSSQLVIDGSGPRHIDLVNVPAGGITSSANDMARYIAMWLSGEDDVLSANGKAMMMKSSSPSSPSYGMGWSINSNEGTVYHTGLVPGSEALVSLRPDKSRGVVVMVNANGGFGFSDTWYLIGGVGARALGLEHHDDGSRWGPKSLYLSAAMLAPLFVVLMIIACRSRSGLRSKRENLLGRLSLWFPLVAMSVFAWFLIVVFPGFFGASIGTLRVYQPDFALFLIAGAVSAVGWPLLRLGLAYGSSRNSV